MFDKKERDQTMEDIMTMDNARATNFEKVNVYPHLRIAYDG